MSNKYTATKAAAYVGYFVQAIVNNFLPILFIALHAFSLPNQLTASARASAVLPTPVGPKNSIAPMGRPGSPKPVRLRRIAPATSDST